MGTWGRSFQASGGDHGGSSHRRGQCGRQQEAEQSTRSGPSWEGDLGAKLFSTRGMKRGLGLYLRQRSPGSWEEHCWALRTLGQ